MKTRTHKKRKTYEGKTITVTPLTNTPKKVEKEKKTIASLSGASTTRREGKFNTPKLYVAQFRSGSTMTSPAFPPCQVSPTSIFQVGGCTVRLGRYCQGQCHFAHPPFQDSSPKHRKLMSQIGRTPSLKQAPAYSIEFASHEKSPGKTHRGLHRALFGDDKIHFRKEVLR